jgi:hypothetical protein
MFPLKKLKKGILGPNHTTSITATQSVVITLQPLRDFFHFELNIKKFGSILIQEVVFRLFAGIHKVYLMKYQPLSAGSYKLIL